AASILAKEFRDRQMIELDLQYPQYQFARHKGYPTALHRELLNIHGPCPQHRRSFKPVRECYV
ncbi:MAG: ribonuclease HII, partial [Gammaproteobacteria bacterium]